jgi:20S proteasome alpha/beta subunit
MMPRTPSNERRYGRTYVVAVVIAAIIVTTTTTKMVTGSTRRSNYGTGNHRLYRSSSNAATKYDRSVTTFDPHGQLLQIQYAQSAASKRTKRTILAMIGTTRNDDDDEDDKILYIATTTAASQSNIQLGNEYYDQPFVYRITQDIYMTGMGLVGDVQMMVSHLRRQAQQHYYNYEEDIPLSQLVTIVTNVQHQCTYQSGVRPLGIVCLLFTLPTTTTPHNSNNIQLFKCSPGGIQEDCMYCTVGYDDDRILERLHTQYSNLINETNTNANSTTTTTTTTTTTNEADVIEQIVAMLHNDDYSDSDSSIKDEIERKENQRLTDVWVFRRPTGSFHANPIHHVVNDTINRTQQQQLQQRRIQHSVTCFANLCHTSNESMQTMRQYYSPNLSTQSLMTLKRRSNRSGGCNRVVQK